VLQHLSGATILFVGYSLASGFGQAGIDNAAHVGGLLAGLALGAAAARPLGLAGWSPLRFGRAALGLAVVAAVVLLLVRGTPEPNLEARESQRLNAAVQELAREDDAVDALMIDLRGRIDRGEVGGEQAVDILERDIVPRWNRQIEALGAIRVRAADRRALREQLIRYASLRRDAARGAVQAIRDDDPRKAEAARRKYEQSQRIIVELLRKAPAN
jgi:rhomboid protease GluP